VINYKDEDFVEKVKELTDGRGADVIYGTPLHPTLLML
jgi:NADPH:quinone reductase-like Zn-dependent oxidoreductase